MMIDRKEIKKSARTLLNTAVPKPGNAAMIFIALFVLSELLGTKLLLSNFSLAEMERYVQYVVNDYYEGALVLLSENLPSTSAYILMLLLRAVVKLVELGFIIFCLNTVRRREAVMGNLLDGFGMAVKYFIMFLVRSAVIAFMSLLLLIPGYIFAYGYRLAPYLMIERPELGPIACLRESRRMMKGHKWELFVLDLSFIGWIILERLGLIGYFVMLYSLPYRQLSYTEFYTRLAAKQE